MSFSDLLQWWNVIFAVPLVMSLVWMIGTIFTGGHGSSSHGQGAHEVSGGVGHTIGHAVHGVEHAVGDAIHHGDAGHGHDLGHAHGHEAGHHDTHASHHGEHNEGFGMKLLAIFGFGRAPVTLVLGIFMLFFGIYGLAANLLLSHILVFPAIYVWPSLVCSFVLSTVTSRTAAGLFARFMPGTESYAVGLYDLVGLFGHVIYAVGPAAGTVDVRDPYGTLHRVQAKNSGGEPIPPGVEVIVVGFDEQDKRFVVEQGTL